MATWQELREMFKKGDIPPETEIEVGGQKVAASAFFGGLDEMEQAVKTKEANLTRWAQQVAAQKQEWERQAEEARRQGANPPPKPGITLDEDDWVPPQLREAAAQDPAYWGSMLRVLEQQRKQNQALQMQVQQVHAENVQYRQVSETQRWQQRHEADLADILKENPALKREDVIRFALSNQIPNLRLATELMTGKDRQEAVRKEAYEKGLAEGKKAAEIPHLPLGMQYPGVMRPKADGPKTMDEGAEAAKSDPEIMQAMIQDFYAGQSGGG